MEFVVCIFSRSSRWFFSLLGRREKKDALEDDECIRNEYLYIAEQTCTNKYERWSLKADYCFNYSVLDGHRLNRLFGRSNFFPSGFS